MNASYLKKMILSIEDRIGRIQKNTQKLSGTGDMVMPRLEIAADSQLIAIQTGNLVEALEKIEVLEYSFTDEFADSIHTCHFADDPD